MAENVWARSFCANEPQADAVPLVLPPGWAVDAVANITQGADPPLQALYVLHNQATNQLVRAGRRG